MQKPVLMIGVEGHVSPENLKHLRERFEHEMPEFRVVIVAGLVYATVVKP